MERPPDVNTKKKFLENQACKEVAGPGPGLTNLYQPGPGPGLTILISRVRVRVPGPKILNKSGPGPKILDPTGSTDSRLHIMKSLVKFIASWTKVMSTIRLFCLLICNHVFALLLFSISLSYIYFFSYVTTQHIWQECMITSRTSYWWERSYL